MKLKFLSAIISRLPQKLSIKSSSSRYSDIEKKFESYCRSPHQQAIEMIGSSWNGIDTSEAEDRISIYGRNLLPEKEKNSFAKDIFERVKNPLVIQLLVICTVSFFMGDMKATVLVGGMIFLSVFLAYFQERRSSIAAEKLKLIVQAKSIVVRGGKEENIHTDEIVPGDIVLLAAGSIIPADVRILSAKDFFVNQSALTGESMPVEKFPELPEGFNGNALTFRNACFQGSTVISGTARALVVHSGADTLLGSISLNLSSEKTKTSFDEGVKSFVWLMIRFMLVMVGLTFLIVGLTKHNWVDALLFSLSVAVGLTPEMLPMIITVCLSRASATMAKKKVIVKKLKAIQNLGAMNILCTDKTGTLTQDRVVLEKHVDVTNRQSGDVLRYAYMNSYYQTGLRNLLDIAILSHDELDVERSCKKIDEIPFDFARKRMSVIIDYEESHVLICKGAVEEVYGSCSRYQIDDEVYPLIDMVKHFLLDEYHELSAQGYRVLAVAYREFSRDREQFSVTDENDMILLGYVTFFDPPKETASNAVKALQNSGVRVKILTGDNDLVTKKVCRDVGLSFERVVTGRELDLMDKKSFSETVRNVDVFAHLTPFHKEKIITDLRSDNVIGFLGDGINDAPAMKAADVGISVDTAVDVAKESADIILLEKSLMILEDGIIEGRRLFNNITKYIKMGSSSNFGNMFSVVGASYFLPFLPMTPIQILTNNLLYDISQTGIPSDNVDDEFIKKPQKWNISFIKRFMTFIGPVSSVFDYATFFLMLYFFNCALFSNADTSPEMKTYYESLFHTGWFVESLLTQTIIVHIIRTNKIPFIQSRPSSTMAFSTIAVMGIGIYLPYSPFASFFGFVPLPPAYWMWIGGFLVSYGIITHMIKTWFNKKFGE